MNVTTCRKSEKDIKSEKYTVFIKTEWYRNIVALKFLNKPKSLGLIQELIYSHYFLTPSEDIQRRLISYEFNSYVFCNVIQCNFYKAGTSS